MKTQIAKLNYLRMAPRKVRLIANLLKGLSINEAEAQLMINPRKATEPLLKLLRSAINNSKQKELNPEKLFIKEIRVDNGPIFKKTMPRAQGRGAMIQKKSSHITLILAEGEKLKEPRFKIKKLEKISKLKAEKINKNKDKKEEKERPAEKFSIKKSQNEGFFKKMFRRKSI